VLDLKLIRDQPDMVRKRLAARGAGSEGPLSQIVESDRLRREYLKTVEQKKALRNQLSEMIAAAKRSGQDASGPMERAKQEADGIRDLDRQVKELDRSIEHNLLLLPNLPHPSVPVGASSEDNPEIRKWGERRKFSFTPRPHEEIGVELGLVDFERAAKIAKSRFTVLWGAAAGLERALTQFMLDLHVREHGYTEVWVPHLVSGPTMLGVGQLPKFEQELFKTNEPEENRVLYLIPTAEVPVTALHSGEFLAETTLPRRYVAFTPCYRREAGTYGQDTKGMLRQHQFDKVELVKITTPAQSYDELESMTRHAEEVLRRLELPYRVVELCTADLGFNAAKTYDLEVWLPGQGKYREISSCSNCEAFQARRADIRYRPAGGGKADHCHTLNGSGLAVGRTLIAVLENYQEADGSVVLPPALRPYLEGLTRLVPP